MTNIKEYFDNYSFNINDFINLDRIIPDKDFNLFIEFIIEKCDVSPAHPSHLGGFIFNHIRFKIDEYTLDDVNNTISHRTLDTISFNERFRHFTPTFHLKANKEYLLDFCMKLDNVLLIINKKNMMLTSILR